MSGEFRSQKEAVLRLLPKGRSKDSREGAFLFRTMSI